MKKILFISLFLLCVISASIFLYFFTEKQNKEEKEEKFVNELFYKRLSPISRGARVTFLTPNQIKTIDIFGNYEIAPCRLVENTETLIALKCLEYNQIFIYKYAIRHCDASDDYCYESDWFVREYVYSSDENDFDSIATFVIK